MMEEQGRVLPPRYKNNGEKIPGTLEY